MNAEALTNSESLTTEEFQRQLCTWIEEKGLLNELRTHLRKKMIFMLQDTTIDKTTSSATRLSLTPKHQALSLLVAEFLLVAELHYSLSVFSSELSNISHVTKFCEKAQNAKTRGETNPKIQSSDVLDILEALGFSTTSKESQNISDLYNNAPDRRESLLCCIIKTMAIMSDMAGSRNPVKHVESCTDFLPPLRSVQSMGDFMQILQDYNLIEYKDIVELFIEKEISRVRTEEKQKYKNKLYQHQKLLAHEIKLRESLVVSKLEQAEKRLFTQKQIIQSDLKKKQNRLQELADELNILHSQLTRREEDIQKQQEEFRCQEAHWKAKQTESNLQLGQRLQELNIKQLAIKSDSEQLLREKEELSTEVAHLHEKKQELEEATKISRTNSEISFLHELRMQCKDLKNELEQTRTTFAKPSFSNEEASASLPLNDKLSKECKVNKPIQKVKETSVINSDKIDIKELLLSLQKENSELRAQLSEHRASISDLRTQLTDCQTIRDLFHSRVVHQLNVPITSAPIITMGAPIPVANTESHTRQTHTLCGAGEDLNLLNNNRQRPPRRASRRSSEICTEHIPTEESDSAEASPTQSVIRDARERLRTLEGESEALERAFQHYKQRIDSRNIERAYLSAAHRDLVDLGVPMLNTVSMSRKNSDYRLPNNLMTHSCKDYNNSECGYSVPVASHYDLMYNDDSEENNKNNVQCISRKYSYDHVRKETVNVVSLNETSPETPSHDDINLLDIDMNSASNCRIKESISIHESNNVSNETSESLINQNKSDLVRCSCNLLNSDKLETNRPSSSPLPTRNVYKSVYKKCSNTTILSHGKCPDGCKLFSKRSDTKINNSLTSFSPPQRGNDVDKETNKSEFVENNINNPSPLINRLPTSSTSCESKISNGKLTVEAVESRTDLSIQHEPSLENESSIENKNSTTMEEAAPFTTSEETSEETSYNENSVSVDDKADTILQLDTKQLKYKKGGYHKKISKKIHTRALAKKRTLLNPRLRSPRLYENRDDLNSGYDLPKIIKEQITVISNEAPESNICDNSRNISDKNLVPSLELSPRNDSNENIHQNISSDAKLQLNDNNIDIMDISKLVLDLLPSDEVDELDDDPVFSIDKPSFSSPIEIGIPDCTCPLIQTPRAHVQFCSSNSALNYESPSDSPRFASNLCATLTDPLLPIYPKKVYSSTMPALTPVSEKTEISENISPKSEETQVSVGKMSVSSTNSW